MRPGYIEKIDDIAEANAVDHIAERAAHDQADGGDQQATVGLQRPPAKYAGGGCQWRRSGTPKRTGPDRGGVA
jgi:hypothetical protein